MQKSTGLTVVELAATLGIIAIIAALAAPSLSRLIQKNRIKSASERLYQSIHFVRTEAIKQNQPVFLSYQTGSNWCIGFATTAACNCSIINNCNLGVITAGEYPNVTFTPTGFGSTTTTFGSMRGQPNQAGTFKFATDSRSIDIIINRMGRIRICGQDIGGYRSCPAS